MTSLATRTAPAAAIVAAPAALETVIEVDNLVKRYPKAATNAVDGVSFAVPRGEIFAMLGPNGAGKTTTTGILTTRISLTSGRATVAGVDVGKDPVSARSRISVVPQKMTLDRSMNAQQNLQFHAAYHDVPKRERVARAAELLEAFDLTSQRKLKPDFMSGGQQQRLMIARALMHRPDVLFLDEPTTGLDPQVRRWVWERIRGLRDEGVAVLLTTHYLDEAAELADRVGIMDHGSLLTVGTPGALTAHLTGTTTLDVAASLPADADPTALETVLTGLPGVERVERIQHHNPDDTDQEKSVKQRLYLSDEVQDVIAGVTACIAEHARLRDLSIGRPSLEDVFIELTGRSLR
jgi:ABC-2 type transport system ATP-binding protein